MAGKKRLTKAVGDYARGLVSQDGAHFRTQHQELGPAIKRVAEIRELQARQTRATNPYGRQFIGSIPAVILTDWLKKHGYTLHQFAVNAGGNKNSGNDPQFFRTDPGVKSQFLRYFLSRDFSKLHTQHGTTRVENGSNRIVVPGQIGGADGDNKLRGAEAGDSQLA